MTAFPPGHGRDDNRGTEMNWQKAYEADVDLTEPTPEERAAIAHAFTGLNPEPKPSRYRYGQTIPLPTPAEYMPGSAVPRYVERLDDVEWVTDRRREPSVLARTLAMIAIVIGGCLLVIGFASMADDRPPAYQFPTRIPTPATSPHAAVPDSGSRPQPAPGVPVVLPR